MQLHDFEIEQFSNRGFGRVKMDGKELHGVQYVNYENRAGDLPEITIRFTVGTLNFKGENTNKEKTLVERNMCGEAIETKEEIDTNTLDSEFRTL